MIEILSGFCGIFEHELMKVIAILQNSKNRIIDQGPWFWCGFSQFVFLFCILPSIVAICTSLSVPCGQTIHPQFMHHPFLYYSKFKLIKKNKILVAIIGKGRFQPITSHILIFKDFCFLFFFFFSHKHESIDLFIYQSQNALGRENMNQILFQ